MDRRKVLKTLVVGSVAGGALLSGCKSENGNPVNPKPQTGNMTDRMAEEITNDAAVKGQTFFTPHEMATLSVLCDIIIPKDEKSGSATEAGVPAFIEFMVNDKPEHQTPLRGGLRWLDVNCAKQYGHAFINCNASSQVNIVTAIAYPKKAATAMQAGVAFFSLLRNLTISGFYTSEMGFADLGYVGNTPNQWNGVPDDVLHQYNLAYSEKELAECIHYDKS